MAAAAVAAGGIAHPIHADSRHEQDVEAAVAQTVDRFGSLDILVNNAAVGSFGPITELKMDEIDAMLTINVRSAIVAIREALAHLGDGGRIINIGSINADRTPFPGQSVHALTKGTLASLTRGLARELAPRGITINNIQPGPIDTDANPAGGPDAANMLGVMAVDRPKPPTSPAPAWTSTEHSARDPRGRWQSRGRVKKYREPGSADEVRPRCRGRGVSGEAGANSRCPRPRLPSARVRV
ncbi:SDR family oxidoreductase [Amycolatopsis cynarae]|uniref:SDR family oxidoreductase n=1 Tax=Amycolatopsis cynarae TaxID=2995223 RepID=A0ABY7BB68_9PSEU|nr:SDR family NAD(P)-dependent oxidoreductase [Amycolatopsis sp. HUAS 11-8]WAL69396.1 SDR family oxidoreductase [Amycolatopsis sp. HUAS 11-8]